MSSVPRSLEVALVAAAALAACASPPDPFEPPEVLSVVTHYAGDPVGGPLPFELALDLELTRNDAFAVRGALYVVADAPEIAADPLTEHVRLILRGGRADPLGKTALVAPGARLVAADAARELLDWLSAADAEVCALSARFEGLSVPSVTAAMGAVYAQPIELLGADPSERRVSVELWRENTASADLAVALVLSDVVESVEDLATDGAPRIVRAERSETIVLDRSLVPGGDPVVVLAPVRFDPTGRMHNVLVLEADGAPEDDEDRAELDRSLELVRAEVRGSALDDAEARRRSALDEQLRRRRLRAIDALDDPETRRAAIVELGGSVGAPLVVEVALMAEDDTLEELATRLLATREVLVAAAGDGAAIAWRLEREAVLMFTEALAESWLPPEYEAVLLRFTGEAGRFPTALEAALVACDGLESFYARILDENWIALEDSSPAARVRAYDWLVSQGVDLGDFDPLAGSRTRRAALRALREAEAAAREAAEASAPDGGGEQG